jgi:hypothetical protein
MRTIYSRLLILCMITLFVSCLDNDEMKDRSVVVNLYVSSEAVGYKPLESDPDAVPGIGMKIRENTKDAWSVISQNAIEGFTYEAGFEYFLKVEKTYLANPLQDAPNIKYKLLNVLSKK